MKYLNIIIVISTLFILSCTTAVNHVPKGNDETPKKLVIFLDGTANDPNSYTNIAKLHNLVTLQSNKDIRTSYIKGVGTEGKVIGMAMGLGIGLDVREAYSFLVNNYQHQRGDEIYIFGFSRGAYAARILSALVYVAGIPEASSIDGQDVPSFVGKIYNAYKGKQTLDQRRQKVSNVIGYYPITRYIEFIGLWDTVEALGIPDYKEEWENPNSRYGDQLCNIKSAAHALSIDDNRARSFTPILFSHSKLIKECINVDINTVIDEVWFSGAHSDVGGGYSDTDISGVSLNWMLSRIKKYEITPNNSAVYSDYLGKTHDPESGIWGLIYRNRNRDLFSYAHYNKYNNYKLKIHRSVLQRLQQKLPKDHEFNWVESFFSHCFESEGRGLRYLESKKCFTIVD